MIGFCLLGIVKGVEFSHNYVSHDKMDSPLNQSPNKDTIIIENTHQGNLGTLRWSQRHKRSMIADDYIVYLQKLEFDIGSKDLVMFLQTNESKDKI